MLTWSTWSIEAGYCMTGRRGRRVVVPEPVKLRRMTSVAMIPISTIAMAAGTTIAMRMLRLVEPCAVVEVMLSGETWGEAVLMATIVYPVGLSQLAPVTFPITEVTL